MVDATDLKSVEPYKLVRVRVSLPPSIGVYLSLPLGKTFSANPTYAVSGRQLLIWDTIPKGLTKG